MRTASMFLICALCLLLTACGTATAVVPTAAPSLAAPTLAAPTLAAPTAAPTVAEPTAAPTEAAPTVSAPTATASIESSPTAAGTESAPVLSEPPQQLIWLAAGQQVPGINAPGPLLIAKQGNALYPFQPDPLTALPPLTIQVPGQVISVAPNLQSLIARGSDGSMGVYDLSGKLLYAIQETNPYFGSYTEDGKTITINTSDEMGIVIYDAATGERIKKLTGFQTAAPVYGGGLVPGGKTAYWIARATLQLQDVESSQMGVEFNYQDFIESLAFSPDGSRLALSVSGKVYLYAVPDGKELAQITRSQPVNALHFSPDGTLLAAGYGAGVQVWDGSTLAPVTSFPGPNDFTGQVAFSPDGTRLAAAHQGGQISIFNLKDRSGG